MENKYVSPTGLSRFLSNLKGIFLSKSDYNVDSTLSNTSTNPVANNVLNAEFEEISYALNVYGLAIDDKSDKDHNHDDLYYTESEIDSKISAINMSIDNIESGDVVVKEAEHSNSADSAITATTATTATSAGSATKATQDASGNVITSTYETKSDASDKLTEAKTYTDTAADTALSSAKSYTDSKTSGLASTSSVTSAISTHNTSTSAHSDIRELITVLTTRLNALADSDDTTLDQMSEIAAYIKSNKSLIDSITTNKINVSDIVNNLTTNSTSKVLSAAQGVAIKSLIDALQTEVDGKAASSHSHIITASASDDDVVVLTGTNGTNKVTYSASHANSGVTAGTYKSVTVDAKGHVTGGTNPTTLSGYGITDATSKTTFDTHTADTTKHITSTERSNWNTAITTANTAKTNAATAQTRADNAYSLAEEKCQVQIITWGADD